MATFIMIINVFLLIVTVGLFLAFLYNVFRIEVLGIRYRGCYSGKDENSSWGGSRECPWKWLAIYRLKKDIENDSCIFHAYVEDISDGVFNERTASGKTIWEWNKDCKPRK